MKLDLANTQQVYRKNKGFLETIHVDGWLLLGIVLLLATSLAIVYSASGGDEAVMIRQAIRIGIAFTIMFVFAQIPPQYYLYIYTLVIFSGSY